MKKINFFGSIPAIVTPFKKNGDLDLAALEKLVDYQLRGGVDAIVVAGSTGEAATLSDEEFSKVIKTVVQKVSKSKIKVPVIAGASSNDTKRAVHLSKLAKDSGADALLHVTPFYNKPTPNGLMLHYKEIAKATDMPIIIYNVPGRTGSNVLPATILRIGREVREVVAVKEASGSLNQMMEIIDGAANEGPKDFTVLSGDDALTLPLIAVGGKGCISVVANEAPKLFSNMVHLALQGKMKEAEKLHYELLPLMNVNFIESNPIPVKTAMARMGLIEESFRLPLTSLEEKNRPIIEEVLKDLKLINR
ncbi:4-hydroxy-tetrahydrodipicolinate synthase [Candidatus Nomurabacteria bacterium]|nr:4-hydroxy-tetrahydrodipicolinate synthase [Candidatus Nomurabacteria bacterium]